MIRRLVVLLVLVALIAVPVVAEFAPSVPLISGSITGAGFVGLYPDGDDATTNSYKPWLVQVTATTDLTFSIWGYGTGDGTTWFKISPEWAVTADDTLLYVAAGVTETYTFVSRVKPSGIYVTGGTGKILLSRA